MDPDRWRQVNQLLTEALELPESERHLFLDSACRGDPALRAEVDSFIAAAQQSAWLDSPAVLNESIASRETFTYGAKFGHYIIQRNLGKGGMGVVYQATDSRLGRPVALKLLSNEASSEQGRSRFAREARAASALNHPNIATIYEFDRFEGTDFIAMEYVDGATLRDVLHERKTPLPQMLEYARQTARALGAAHAAGIVHRDLKPANIMIKTDGTAKVLDFGLAKITAPSGGDILSTRTMLTVAGAVMGTPAYMSPEQVSGADVDFRSDVFAFGVLLYEMACGKRPFEAPNMHSTLHLIATAEPRRVSDLNSAAPPALISLIDRCLRKRKDERLQSMAEAERELADILTPVHENSAAATSRRGILVAGATAASALLGIGYWFLRPSPVAAVSCTIEVSGPDGQPHPASFRDTFESGSRFRLNAVAKQPGYLYIVSGEPHSTAPLSVLSGGSLPADRPLLTQWLIIEGPPGTDAIWLVWSQRPIEMLDRPSNQSAIRSIISPLQPASPGVDGGIELRGAANPMGTRVEIHHR